MLNVDFESLFILYPRKNGKLNTSRPYGIQGGQLQSPENESDRQTRLTCLWDYYTFPPETADMTENEFMQWLKCNLAAITNGERAKRHKNNAKRGDSTVCERPSDKTEEHLTKLYAYTWLPSFDDDDAWAELDNDTSLVSILD